MRKVCVGDGSANVDGRCGGGVQNRPRAESTNLGREVFYETIVDFWEHDDALDADTILTGRLEDTAHEDAGYSLEVAVGKIVEEYRGVFASQLNTDWDKGLCR